MKKEIFIGICYCIIGYLMVGLVQIVESIIDLIKQEKPILKKDTHSLKICYDKDDICYHVNTIDQRNNIPIDQRRIGMIVYVVETDCSYILETNPMTRYTLDGDWCQIIRADLNNQEHICLC